MRRRARRPPRHICASCCCAPAGTGGNGSSTPSAAGRDRLTSSRSPRSSRTTCGSTPGPRVTSTCCPASSRTPPRARYRASCSARRRSPCSATPSGSARWSASTCSSCGKAQPTSGCCPGREPSATRRRACSAARGPRRCPFMTITISAPTACRPSTGLSTWSRRSSTAWTAFPIAPIPMPPPLRSGRDSAGWPARFTRSRACSWSICCWPSRWPSGKPRHWSTRRASTTPRRRLRSSGASCKFTSRTLIYASSFTRISCPAAWCGRYGTVWTDPSWSASRSPWTASSRFTGTSAWPRRRPSASTGTGSPGPAGATAGAAARTPPSAWHDQGVRKDDGAATTSAELRAHNLARLLRAIHAGGGQLTRAELTRQLSLARGTATVLVRDLAGRGLIEELTSPVDASVQRARGRPTGIPSAHSAGPVALAVDLRDDSFTVAAFELTGRCTVLDRQERDAGSGTGMLSDVADRLKLRSRQFGGRVVGVGVAVPSPVSGGTMVQPTLPEWQDVDVAAALGPAGAPGSGLLGSVLTGNDATLAGLAEARRGVLRGVSVALHLHVATGIGGVLLADGLPVSGAYGSAGEFGHMPLTGGDEPCRCGSVGCWELDAGARGLLRAVGKPEEGDRMVQAELVNAEDPEAVGLSGLAADMYQADPRSVTAGYLSTLMRFRRADPPALLPSTLGDLGALTGASELVFDAFLTPRGLGTWPSPGRKTA